MRKFAEFLKTTSLGGLFVLLPVLLLYLVLAEAMELVVTLATPISDLFPKGTFDETASPVIIALILIVGVSFLVGLGLRSKSARGLGHSIENTVLDRLPMYTVLKSLTKGFATVDQSKAFKPAVPVSPDGNRELAYLIEDHGNGNATVMLPWVPTAFAGTLKIVKQDRIEMLDVNLADFTKVLGHWGVGVRDLLEKIRSLSMNH
jgi:uncharacterized membrane protein